MSAPREVVSLVCGPFSSFVGAHMWNFQVRSCDKRPQCRQSPACSIQRPSAIASARTELTAMVQDELLGLNATTTEVPYVDPNVLFRFGEHRVSHCKIIAVSFRLCFRERLQLGACLLSWAAASSVEDTRSPAKAAVRKFLNVMQGQSTCNPRALVLDMQGSLGGIVQCFICSSVNPCTCFSQAAL